MLRIFLAGNKKGQTLLDTIIRIIPAAIAFLLVSGVLYYFLTSSSMKDENYPFEQSFKFVTEEIKSIEEGETMMVPIFTPNKDEFHRFILYPEEGKGISKKKPRFCLYLFDEKKGENDRKCEEYSDIKLKKSCVEDKGDLEFIELKMQDGEVFLTGTC